MNMTKSTTPLADQLKDLIGTDLYTTHSIALVILNSVSDHASRKVVAKLNEITRTGGYEIADIRKNDLSKRINGCERGIMKTMVSLGDEITCTRGCGYKDVCNCDDIRYETEKALRSAREIQENFSAFSLLALEIDVHRAEVRRDKITKEIEDVASGKTTLVKPQSPLGTEQFMKEHPGFRPQTKNTAAAGETTGFDPSTVPPEFREIWEDVVKSSAGDNFDGGCVPLSTVLESNNWKRLSDKEKKAFLTKYDKIFGQFDGHAKDRIPDAIMKAWSKDEDYQMEVPEKKRKRGRPRKNIAVAVTDDLPRSLPNGDTKKPRKRGRPRKNA